MVPELWPQPWGLRYRRGGEPRSAFQGAAPRRVQAISQRCLPAFSRHGSRPRAHAPRRPARAASVLRSAPSRVRSAVRRAGRRGARLLQREVPRREGVGMAEAEHEVDVGRPGGRCPSPASSAPWLHRLPSRRAARVRARLRRAPWRWRGPCGSSGRRGPTPSAYSSSAARKASGVRSGNCVQTLPQIALPAATTPAGR